MFDILSDVNQKNIKYLFLVIALLLIFSFVAHDLIPHSHNPAIYGSGVQAAFHGNDRKWLFFAILVFIFAIASLLKKIKSADFLSINPLFLKKLIKKIFDPLLRALRRGILNPKLHD